MTNMQWLASALLAATVAAAPVQAAVFSAAGPDAAAIQGAVNSFRAALGANNGVGGSFAGGRREVNWDGVPAGFSDPNALPANFFNSNSARGMVLSNAPGFLVSTDFTNINAGYAGQFQTFSATKLFSSTGSPDYDVTFFIPGTAAQTTVTAFGAVFTDVELASRTILQYFDENNVSLGQFAVPVSGNGGLSFLGVTWPGQKVSRVRVFQGTHALGANTFDDSQDQIDVVVADDFIFDEPFNPNAESVPEPSTLGFMCAGMAMVWFGRKRLQ